MDRRKFLEVTGRLIAGGAIFFSLPATVGARDFRLFDLLNRQGAGYDQRTNWDFGFGHLLRHGSIASC